MDRQLLALIKQGLVAAVEEDDERGNRRRTRRARDEKRGIPQGAPISPLLANLYMRRFILGWKVLGHQQRLRACIVNYADDFDICCRVTAAEETVGQLNRLLTFWGNYFCLGAVSKAYRAIDRHSTSRLR